jgi:hypothetical protein
MKNLFFLFTLIFFSLEISAQTFTWKKNALEFGYGISKADRRADFYEGWIGAEVLESIRNDDSNYEDDYFINYNRVICTKNRVELRAGLGYILNVNYFSHIIGLLHFDNPNYILLRNYKYYKSCINIPITVNLSLFKYDKKRIDLSILSNSNIAFYKKVFVANTIDLSFKKRVIEPSDFELYTGLNFECKWVGLGLHYRLLNLAFQDNALGNNGAKTDWYNPTKLRIAARVFF